MAVSILDPTPPTARVPSTLFTALTANVTGHILTMIVGGILGFVGSWYTVENKVDAQERRLESLEQSTVRKPELDPAMQGIRTSLESIDRRLGSLESAVENALLEKK